MCIPDTLQKNILEATKGGYDIASFLAETMRGETLGVKVNHRLEAAKHLIRYGFPDDHSVRPGPVEGPTTTRLSRAGGNPVGEEQGGESSPPSMSVSVSHLDILNYEVAHLIRSETAEGHTVVKFLVEIMTGRDRPFTPKKFRIKPADRMAAARELLQTWLRRLRLQAQTVRQQRRSKRLRHPAHRPRQANARIQRARRRHHPLPP